MAIAKTQILTKLVVDCATGQEIIRELTDEELAQLEKDALEDAARQAERNAKVAARQSALTKLEELGLTEAEIAAL